MSEITERFFTILPRLIVAGDESDLLKTTYRKTKHGFSYVFIRRGKTHTVTVHSGFLTNGQSLPPLARKLLTNWIGQNNHCIALHDWLCEYLLIEKNYKAKPITIHEALDIFIDSLNTTSLTCRQKWIIKMLCKTSNLLKRSNHVRFNPYKRYLEDQRFGICN